MKRNEEQNDNANKRLTEVPPNKSATASELEDKIELERREAYTDPLTRDVLRTLLSSENQAELVPIYYGAGFEYQLPYQMSERFNNSVPKEHLLTLTQLDILSKKFHATVAACPKCESIKLTMHNRCPLCKSHDIEKTNLTEHILCGYIDQRNNYINDRCPKCGEILSDKETRNMGRWYLCKSCNDKFENPELDVLCHNCGKSFSTKEAHILEVPKFTLNPSRIKEIRQNVASLEDIQTLLKKLNFDVKMPGLAIGEKSGIHHHFSLTATKLINQKEIMIALDHAVSETEVSQSPLILYIYKTSEIQVDIPIFVAMPKLNDTAKKIAQGRQILVVEGSTDNPETIKHIEQEIENRILKLTTTSKTTEEIAPKKIQEKSSLFKKAKHKISVLAEAR
jgi:predicted RNA-binding Zn-ribbon protein involved in translation (DUF1610 family)